MLSQLGLDTIGKDCVGTDFDSLKSSKNNKMLAYLKLFNTSANAHLLEIIMHLFPFWLLELLPIKAVQYARNKTDLVRETVQDEAVENMSAQDHGQEEQDMDDKNMIDCMRRDLLSPEQVVNNALTMVTAGHEEIGTALTWVVYFLIHHPEVQTRLRHDTILARRHQRESASQAKRPRHLARIHNFQHPSRHRYPPSRHRHHSFDLGNEQECRRVGQRCDQFQSRPMAGRCQRRRKIGLFFHDFRSRPSQVYR
jgi:cytochrome P450